MALQIFNVRKTTRGDYFIDTTYNHYQMIVDKVKGIAIYMDIPGNSNALYKTFRHNNTGKAMMWLFNKEVF